MSYNSSYFLYNLKFSHFSIYHISSVYKCKFILPYSVLLWTLLSKPSELKFTYFLVTGKMFCAMETITGVNSSSFGLLFQKSSICLYAFLIQSDVCCLLLFARTISLVIFHGDKIGCWVCICWYYYTPMGDDLTPLTSWACQLERGQHNIRSNFE